MKYDYHIIVLGAGSAGLVVASGAAQLGAKVALVEADKMGGDCLNSGCVPSKAFLKCAHTARAIQRSSTFGITSKLAKIDLEKVMDRVRETISQIAPHDSKEKYEKQGIDVIHGRGRFADDHTIHINGVSITAKSIVIATGSMPRIPSIKGLDTVRYHTNGNIFQLKKVPTKLIILGAGYTGLELGQGFAYLGADVTIIDKQQHIFYRDNIEVAPMMEKIFTDEGVKLKLNAKIIEVTKEDDDIVVTIKIDNKIEKIYGDCLLVALGRAPMTIGLGLKATAIKTNSKGYIKTDSKMRTNVGNIYACGDVVGSYQFTHTAGHQAGVVVKNIIFKLGAKVDYSAVPWTTYTKPEVAHVGYTQATATAAKLYKSSITLDLADNDRAIINNDTTGYLKLVLGRRDRIIGATIVADNAGEMIPVVTLSIKKKLKPSAFLGIIFLYPTESEVLIYAALEKLLISIKDWQRKLIRLLFLGK
ncbi:MAG: FAD-dependent oxidoreductase [Clostridiales bacterium]|nr:FAD-dependent oxidoreductase [Clostridiales bacterium]